MKRYQVIMPILLPLALVGSAFYMVQGRVERSAQYQQYMQAAQEYQKNGVIVDAIAAYEAALAIDPSLETYLAVGQIYLDQESYSRAEDWYEDELLPRYPNEAATYAYGIQTKLAQNNCREAFQVYDLYQERGLQSDQVEQAMRGIWYSFDLAGDYTQVTAFDPDSGIAAVQREDTWGYANTSGSMVLQAVYPSVGAFSQVGPVVNAEGEAYYADTAGNKKITASYFLEKDPDFGQITAFGALQSGLVPAYNGEIWNYYDAETHEKRFGGYKDATAIFNGVGAVNNGSGWALIDQNGQELTGFDYQQVLAVETGAVCRADALIVQKDGKYQLVDRQGSPIGNGTYESAWPFYENRPAAVQKDGRWIFVDVTGAEQDLGDFEQAKSFSAGVAAAKQNGKWGYINTAGEWIIEPQFLDAGAFSSAGSAFVQTDEDEWQLLRLHRFYH